MYSSYLYENIIKTTEFSSSMLIFQSASLVVNLCNLGWFQLWLCSSAPQPLNVLWEVYCILAIFFSFLQHANIFISVSVSLKMIVSVYLQEIIHDDDLHDIIFYLVFLSRDHVQIVQNTLQAQYSHAHVLCVQFLWKIE